MFPSDSQGGNPFDSSGGSFGGDFGAGPPSDNPFDSSSFDDGLSLEEQALFDSWRRQSDVIRIGLHFHERLRKNR
jgi:hypothetical protein